MSSATRRRSAFTLIELLISVTLTLIIATLAITSITSMLAMARRLQALQTMDASAKTLYEKLSSELAAMHPCAAIWLTSDPADKSVELVFMRTKDAPLDHIDSRREWRRQGATELGYTDLVWTRWYWRWDSAAATGTIHVSTSRPARWTRILGNQTRDYWKIPGGSKLGNAFFSSFLSIPRLVPATGTATEPNSPRGVLDANSWGSGEATDVGDYADLTRSARPLLGNCTDLRLELVSRDGTVHAADADTPLAFAAEGAYVDASDAPGLSAAAARSVLDRRPAQARLRFTLSDSKTGATRTYSFSFATPAIPVY